MLPFFHSDGKTPVSRHWLKIVSSGLQIQGPHTFNIRILILSWPCALFGSRFWITFAILSWEKLTQNRRLSVMTVMTVMTVISWICDENLLLLLIKEHYVSLKSLTILFSWNKGGIRVTVLLFKRRLSREQYALHFLLTLVSFLSSVHNSFVLTYLLRSLTVPEDG